MKFSLPGMFSYLDFVNLMTYDFHDFAEGYKKTAYNSPLYPPKDWKIHGEINNNVSSDNQRSVAWSVNYWVNRGNE